VEGRYSIHELIDMFWTEYNMFSKKQGVFAQTHIWKSMDIAPGRAHLWHQKYSLRQTTILGKLACRVCSKILGIGSAERSWGDVKHLKTNKRAHLTGDKVKKQATLFGAYCVERAESKQRLESKDETERDKIVDTFWRDEDFETAALHEETKKSVKKHKKVLRLWIEDWEKEAIRKKDDRNETKLLQKYGGLVWEDPDCGGMKFTACGTHLHWQKKTARQKDFGYCIIGLREDYNEDKEETFDYWTLEDECALHDCLKEYYEKHPSEEILVLTKNPVTSNDD